MITPERIQNFKQLHYQKHPDCDSYLTIGDFNSLMSALEESQKEARYWKQVQKDYQIEHEAVCARLKKTDDQLEESQKQISKYDSMLEESINTIARIEKKLQTLMAGEAK